jgi:hypothetical protein
MMAGSAGPGDETAMMTTTVAAQRSAERRGGRCCYPALPYCCYLDIPHPLLHPCVKCECFWAAVGLAAAPAGVGHEARDLPVTSLSRSSTRRVRAGVRVNAAPTPVVSR